MEIKWVICLKKTNFRLVVPYSLSLNPSRKVLLFAVFGVALSNAKIGKQLCRIGENNILRATAAADASKSHYRCKRCSQLFSHANNLIRHHGTCGRQSLFYCPDCPTWAPLRRQDNYSHHRKTKHGEKDGAIKPYSKCPPSYRRPLVQKNRFVLMDFTS